ncbi:hypothetical protein WICPIJ_006123 [Wickerhamomyces pijperi]|uniref:Uncharacterized protein n=1 Tax=Wickerhamomyces pijperi TaxID=599730 RepID=A0A9P8TKH2_WICPI|nr:hypothetical protein WICPIJ_006123 [Wickerhamomyces pijperi]
MIFPSFVLPILLFLTRINCQGYYNTSDSSQSVFLTHITAFLRVTAVTTYIPTATTIVTNHATYRVTDAPTTLTITHCPCDLRTDVTIPATPVTTTKTYSTFVTAPTHTTTVLENWSETVTLTNIGSSYTLTNYVATQTNAVFIIPTGKLPGEYVTVTISPPSPTAIINEEVKRDVSMQQVYVLGEGVTQIDNAMLITSVPGVGKIGILATKAESESMGRDYQTEPPLPLTTLNPEDEIHEPWTPDLITKA